MTSVGNDGIIGRAPGACVVAFAAMNSRLPPAILLMGPTASGKTAVAMALADRFPLELVSVDSAQVFIDMDIGTAKPDAATLARYPHRLIDLISPESSYSAARFRADALAAMAAITAAGKVPLLVGGTMLYFRALLHGLADLPQADPALRAEIDAEAAREGLAGAAREIGRSRPVDRSQAAPDRQPAHPARAGNLPDQRPADVRTAG